MKKFTVRPKSAVKGATYGTPDSPRKPQPKKPKRTVKLTEEMIEQVCQECVAHAISEHPEYKFLANCPVWVSVDNLGTEYRKDIDIEVLLEYANNTIAENMLWSDDFAPSLYRYKPGQGSRRYGSIVLLQIYLPHDAIYTGDVYNIIHDAIQSKGARLFGRFATPKLVSQMQSAIQKFKEQLKTKLLDTFPSYVVDVRYSPSFDLYPYQSDPQSEYSPVSEHVGLDDLYVRVEFRDPTGDGSSDWLKKTIWLTWYSDEVYSDFVSRLQKESEEVIQSAKNFIYSHYDVNQTDESEMKDVIWDWVENTVVPKVEAAFPGYPIDVSESDGIWYLTVQRTDQYTYGGKLIQFPFFDMSTIMSKYFRNEPHPPKNFDIDRKVIRFIKKAFDYRRRNYGD